MPNWDEKLNGFKIAVVSDLHIGTKNVDLNRVEKIIDKINKNHPDLIAILGDFDSKMIKNSGYSNEELTGVFRKFKAKYGVIAILGNHDYATPGTDDIKTFLKASDIEILENEMKYIFPNGQMVKIVGFKDLWYFNLDPKKLVGHISSPTIVLMHNPDSFAQMPKDVTLSLSGHTHGGEVVLPFFGSPIVPSVYGQRYRKGHIVEYGKHLYVSGGIASLSHFRFLNPPEISILSLYMEDDKTRILNTKPKKGFTKEHWLKSIKILKFLHIL